MKINELLFPRPYFDSDEGGGGGGEGNQSDADNANGGGNSGEGQGDGDQTKTVTMSQEDFDALMTDRANRAKSSAVNNLLSELGIDDADTLKNLVKRQKEAEDAQKTELEKAQGQITSLESDLESANETIKSLRIRQAVQSTIADQGLQFHSMDDVFEFINLSAVEIDGDGNVSNADKAVKALAKDKPYLLKTETDDAPNIDAKKGTGKGDDKGIETDREQELRGRYGI